MISAALPCADGQPLIVFNGYFPQGESRDHPIKFPAKTRFYADLQAHLEQNFDPAQRIVVMGDLNISPEDCDIGIGEANRSEEHTSELQSRENFVCRLLLE